jgi:hypothetical protein
MRRTLIVLFACLAPSAVVAQTRIVTGGILGDSSIAAPAISWTRISSTGDRRSLSLNGWQIAAALETRTAPKRKLVFAFAVTPLHAHSSDHIYVLGERRKELEYDDANVEIAAGRVDELTSRWQSDVRAVLLYERVDNVDGATKEFWDRPFAGVRSRQSWRRVTSENPFRMTFVGTELVAEAEVFAGKESWGRLSGEEAHAWRRGRMRFAERGAAFTGKSLNVVNRFLVGGSWPIAGLRPLYGFRYGEFRLRRGVTVNADVEYAMTDKVAVTAHASALRGDNARAFGTAVDVTAEWKGFAIRAGVGIPHQSDHREQKPLIYFSLLGAVFR